MCHQETRQTRVCVGFECLALSLILFVAPTTLAATESAAADREPPLPDVGHCSPAAPLGAPFRCEDRAITAQSQDSHGWKLFRSRDPRGGPDAISIMHVADLSNSDPDIAGIMLRCVGNGDGIETLVIVIEPRPPRARPHVVTAVSGASATFEATVVPPFTALLLPEQATALITGPWKSASELTVQVESEQGTGHGVILLRGLRPALELLTTNCVSR